MEQKEEEEEEIFYYFIHSFPLPVNETVKMDSHLLLGTVFVVVLSFEPFDYECTDVFLSRAKMGTELQAKKAKYNKVKYLLTD